MGTSADRGASCGSVMTAPDQEILTSGRSETCYWLHFTVEDRGTHALKGIG